MSQRELATLPLTPKQRELLLTAGFRTVADVHGIKASVLAAELSVPATDAQAILQVVRDADNRTQSKPLVKSALELFQMETQRTAVPTLCEAIDNMLGCGGLPLMKITEICGAPGIGKTQLAMQLALNVQIPEIFGGLDGEAVYIDTEGSFIPARAQALAAALLRHVEQLCVGATDEDGAAERLAAVKALSVERLLERIHYYRIHNYPEQLAVLHLLPELCQQHPKIRLVVVDSVAFHFRQEFRDMALRTRLLNGMAQLFLRLATQQELAVVLINQMTTRIGRAGEASHLIPALGETWGHACTMRVILSWQGRTRCATLYKSPSAPEATVAYSITADGVRGVPAGDGLAGEFTTPAIANEEDDGDDQDSGRPPAAKRAP